MRLAELEPRWLINEPDRKFFIFRCPHCRTRWLCCKNFPMKVGEQMDLFREAMRQEPTHKVVVPMKADVCWKIEKPESWDTLSVQPSIDASPSGDWHGFITNGAVA